MQQPLNLAAVRPVIDRMAATLWPVLRRSVSPITVIRDDLSLQWGTGTFFRVADESFLVTACHVWDTAVKKGFERNLHVFDFEGGPGSGERVRPVSLEGTVHQLGDPDDVAVFSLAPTTVSQLGGCHFLRLSEVGLRPQEPGHCWVYGFPTTRTERVPSRSLFQFNPVFLLLRPTRTGDSLADYSPDHQFLLDASRDDLWQRDGTPGDLPYYLNGISGCSIWQTQVRGDSVENWDPVRTRIVGVQTSYYTGPSIIKATYWAAVAHVLGQARPDLRPALDLHLGPLR